MLSKLRFFILFYNDIDNNDQYLILYKISFRQIMFKIYISEKELNIFNLFLLIDILTSFHPITCD